MQVQQLGYAAMKGSRHVGRSSVVLTAGGVRGDRELCLVDPDARVVLKTVRHPRLLQAVVDVDAERVSVALAGGVVRAAPVATGEWLEVDYWGRPAAVEVLDGPWATRFSAHLGRPVVLTRAAPGAVVYGAAVSLVTTSAARELESRLGAAVDQARFRASVVVDTGDGDPDVEDTWLGRELRLGEATVTVRAPVTRCAVIDLDPATGVKDLGVLAALATYRRSADGIAYGVDAVVGRPGTVRPGDPVELL